MLCVPDRLLDSDMLPTLCHDLTLLNHLGLRLVLCFGLRAQIDARLGADQDRRIVDGRRVTDDRSLEEILSAAGHVRALFERRLSMALPNTPMTGARIHVSSGNYVIGQPFGVHDGVDYQHTGSVRSVQVDAIEPLLEAGHVVLMPPLGYSLTGEVFNLPAEEVAVAAATALRADKLAFFLPALPLDEGRRPIRQASAAEIEAYAAHSPSATLARTLERAADACRRGVGRVHLLPLEVPSALLEELYTRDGSGTLVTAELWESLRPASIDDVGGIIELIAPLQANGTLARRSREQLELDIDNFVVCERDGTVVACAALYVEDAVAEIACVATHRRYRGEGRADQLLGWLETRARQRGCREVYVLSTRTAHWFIERGFDRATPDELPPRRRASYDRQRNSKVFRKRLD